MEELKYERMVGRIHRLKPQVSEPISTTQEPLHRKRKDCHETAEDKSATATFHNTVLYVTTIIKF